jgi:membrane dipeptidase
MLDRRELLALSAAAVAGVTGRFGLSRAAALTLQNQTATVIDALGSPGGSSSGALTAEEIADIRASGLTAVNLTVSAVGVLSGAFEETVKGIAY